MLRPVLPGARPRCALVAVVVLAAAAPAAEPLPDAVAPPARLLAVPLRPAVHRFSELEGVEVRHPSGEALGQMVDAVFEPENGCLRFVVLAFGGTLGIGEESVAVPWEVMRRARVVGEADNELAVRLVEVELATELLASAPRFGEAERRALDGPWRRDVRAHFRVEGDDPPAAARAAALSGVVGRAVLDGSGEPFGQVQEVLVDWRRGRVAALVIQSGGVAGIGGRQRLGPWVDLELTRGEDGDRLCWGIRRERFEEAPEYRDDRWAEVSRQESIEALFRLFERDYPGVEDEPE